jgi:hypothetical protein
MIFMLKGQSDIISAIIIIVIAIGLVGTAFTWGLPLIQKQQDTAMVERVANYFSNDNTNSIQKEIVSVATNGGEESFTEDVPGFWQLVSNNGANSIVNPNGLVGYWMFDEGRGTSTFDSSGNGNAGTLNGNPAWTTNSSCIYGSCLFFDGSSQYIDVGQSSSLNTDDQKRPNENMDQNEADVSVKDMTDEKTQLILKRKLPKRNWNFTIDLWKYAPPK